jgi:hypothetical protein
MLLCITSDSSSNEGGSMDVHAVCAIVTVCHWEWMSHVRKRMKQQCRVVVTALDEKGLAMA